jgi:hypothetical protein
MVDKLVSIVTTALCVTAVGIALRPKAPTANVIKAAGSALANVERATYGPA